MEDGFRAISAGICSFGLAWSSMLFAVLRAWPGLDLAFLKCPAEAQTSRGQVIATRYVFSISNDSYLRSRCSFGKLTPACPVHPQSPSTAYYASNSSCILSTLASISSPKRASLQCGEIDVTVHSQSQAFKRSYQWPSLLRVQANGLGFYKQSFTD